MNHAWRAAWLDSIKKTDLLDPQDIKGFLKQEAEKDMADGMMAVLTKE